MLNESNISKAYHYTDEWNFNKMLESGLLNMSMAYGSESEERFSEGKYPYFLSATQFSTPKEGYASKYPDPIRLELDMEYLSNKGVFKRVKFFDRESMHGKTGRGYFYYQGEDRFLTEHGYFPLWKAVKSVKAYGDTKIRKEYMDEMDRLGIGHEGLIPIRGAYRNAFSNEKTIEGVAHLAIEAIRKLYGDGEAESAYESGVKSGIIVRGRKPEGVDAGFAVRSLKERRFYPVMRRIYAKAMSEKMPANELFERLGRAMHGIAKGISDK